MQHILKKILSTFFCYCICITSIAQEIPLSNLYIRHINQKDGLLYNKVRCFLQDSYNYMWIGSAALQRYDGYRFKNYFTVGENLLFNALLEDSSKQIWAGANNGLYRLNREKDKFELFADKITVNGRQQKLAIQNMVCDVEGTIWFGCGMFYAKLSKKDSAVQDASTLFLHNGNSNAFFLSLDDEGKLWVQNLQPFGIMCYDTKMKILYHHFNNPQKNTVFDLPLKNMNTFNDNHGNIWMNGGFDTRKLYRYHKQTNKLSEYVLRFPVSYKKDNIAVPGNMLADAKGNFYIQLHERLGMARYNIEKDEFEYLFADKDKENSLYDDFSFANPSAGFYIDRHENIWYGGDGINLFSPSHQLFIVNNGLLNETIKKNKPSINKLHSTPNGFKQMADGYYYAVYYGDGLWKFDSSFNAVQKIALPPSAATLLWDIFSADKENLFWGDQYKQLFTMNIRSQKIQLVSATKFPAKHITSSYVENKTTVWVGHWKGGISLFNPVTYQTIQYPLKLLPDSASSNNLTDIEPEGKEHLWLSFGNSGLHLFNKTNGVITFSWYPQPIKKDETINQIYSIERYNSDTLLLCTAGGFIIFNQLTKRATTLTIYNGLPDNHCFASLLEDNKNYVWINTGNKGIFRLNLKSLSVSTYLSSEGNTALYGDLFETKLTNGDLLFNNTTGFTIFNPAKFNKTILPANVKITELWINGKSFNLDSALSKQHGITFPYSKNNIKIKFSALNFWQSANIKYYIKTDNKSEWMPLDNNAEVEYLNMPPGNYQFKIAAAYQDKIPDTASAQLHIYIKPPFYKSWWFLILCSLLLVGLSYVFYRWRLISVRKEAGLKQKIAETEMQALRAQMNPHFIFNSLNSIENFIMQNEKRLASDYLNKFSKLIRIILESNQQSLVPLSADMEALQLYIELEQLRFKNKFTYQTNINEELLNSDYRVPPLLIQPFVENAILHGIAHSDKATNTLTISASIENDYVYYTVEDNGIGRNKAAEYNFLNKPNHKSVGLYITQERIELHNNEPHKSLIKITDLFNAKNEAIGTRVEVKIKIK